MLARFARLPIALRGLLLAAVMIAAAAFAAPWAYGLGGSTALLALLVAASTCLFSAELALGVFELLAAQCMVLGGMGVSMLVRMTLPLALGLLVHLKVAALADVGFLFYLVAFYLIALGAETILMIASLRALQSPAVPSN